MISNLVLFLGWLFGTLSLLLLCVVGHAVYMDWQARRRYALRSHLTEHHDFVLGCKFCERGR